MVERVVIVGAGQAGATLATTLRSEGFRGEITLVGAEPHPPYQRPPLSKKYLLGEFERDRLLLRPPTVYEENGIALRTATRAVALDRENRRLRLEGGEELPYDRLALCTGAQPRTLPREIGGDLAGVHYMRTIEDADALRAELMPGRRALIVGGGYIGLEAAAVCAQRGMAVTVVEMAPRILVRVACAETAAFIRDLHRRHGVDIREGVGVARLLGGKRVTGAELTDGSGLAVDFVIVGIGIAPEVDLAAEAGLTIDDGIAVDAQCLTDDPAVYAAGDCASFPLGGRRVRLESVQNAVDQATHAARAMLGEPRPYAPVPWFWSDQYDTRLQIAGLGQGYDRIVSRPGARPGSASFWYFRGGSFLAVDAIGDPRAYMQGRRWLEAGLSPDPERLADPATELSRVG